MQEVTIDSGLASIPKSKETLPRSSRSGSTGSLRSEDTTRLSDDEQRLVAAYWPLSRKAACEIKKRIRKKRCLTTEEEDYIDDFSVDSLITLIRNHLEVNNLGGYLVASFKNIVMWYRSPTLSTTVTLSEKIVNKLTVTDADFNILEQLNPPHKEQLQKILDSGGSVRDAFTETERKQWNRVQKEEVETYFRSIYDEE